MPGKGKPFVAGDSRINKTGRPAGSVSEKWYSLNWWFSLIQDNYEKLTPREKVELGAKGLNMLVAKMQNLPKTPEESAHRVLTSQQQEAELKEAETVNASPPQ